MGNEQSSPLQHAAAHDDIDKVHALISESRIELNGTDKVGVARAPASTARSTITDMPTHMSRFTGRMDPTTFCVILGQPQGHERVARARC